MFVCLDCLRVPQITQCCCASTKCGKHSVCWFVCLLARQPAGQPDSRTAVPQHEETGGAKATSGGPWGTGESSGSGGKNCTTHAYTSQ